MSIISLLKGNKRRSLLADLASLKFIFSVSLSIPYPGLPSRAETPLKCNGSTWFLSTDFHPDLSWKFATSTQTMIRSISQRLPMRMLLAFSLTTPRTPKNWAKQWNFD